MYLSCKNINGKNASSIPVKPMYQDMKLKCSNLDENQQLSVIAYDSDVLPGVIQESKNVDDILKNNKTPLIEEWSNEDKSENGNKNKNETIQVHKNRTRENLPKSLLRNSIIDENNKSENSIVGGTSKGDLILIEPIIYRRNCLWITPMPASAFKNSFTAIPKQKYMKH